MTEHRVRIAGYAVDGADSCMSTIGLGSCVAIILHDADARIGGLAHVLLPDAEYVRDLSNPAKFPASAVPLLVAEMRKRGSRGGISARLVGGAKMFASLLSGGGMNVGERNVAASRDALAKAGIPITGEQVGGEMGRSVRFEVANGRVFVRTVKGEDCVL